uniref:PR domain containing 1b, with ZNF domain n=1 Tax=Lates calcarifer TaxID=8187 RepID=A0A4W6F071_LATCA
MTTAASQCNSIGLEPEYINYNKFCRVKMKLDSAPGDMSGWREVDFALNCTYIVPDQVSDPSFSLPKAMTSIPRNLTFEYGTDNEVTGVFSKEYIPQGTRFGPLQGDIYTKDNVPKQANRKYFWRIYSGGQLQNFLDGYDVHRSNWMRYVNPARSMAEQNLVACQNGRDIYFYTIRPVEPKQELLVWYSQEFAQRLCSQQDDIKQSECCSGRFFCLWMRIAQPQLRSPVLAGSPPRTPNSTQKSPTSSPRPLRAQGGAGPPYQLLPPYSPHYPRLLLPSYSPPFPGMLPSRGSLRYSNYLGTDGLPYPPISSPSLLPVSLPYPPSPQGGLKELTPNVSPPRGAPATPELSPLPKPSSQHQPPEQAPSGCEEAMNLSLTATKSNTAPRNGPGHKSLPYPLKKQNGKIKYECNICSKTFGQLSNLKVTKHHLVHTGEKPHECQVFISHVNAHRGHNLSFPVSFFHRFSLRIHQRSCCLANSNTPVNVHMKEMVERFDASQEADTLTETASAPQVEEAVEHWLARTLEGEGKEDQKEATILLKALTAAINAPAMPMAQSVVPASHQSPPLAYQERASVVHLHKRPTVKTEGQ